MKVFVTGATGVLGRPTVRRLAAAGHAVRGLARSAGNEALLRRLGAEPVRADLFDRPSLDTAVDGCEAVLHLATKIPPFRQALRRSAWYDNDRIRSEGTRLLVDAALGAGVTVLVYPGVCFFYPDRGSDWIEAADPVETPTIMASSLAAEAEVARFARAGGRGIVLRMGSFYGPDAPSTREALALARRGIAPLPGRRAAYWPQIWVDDAADAVVAAMLGAPSGLYDVVDDEPLTRREITAVMARAAGRRRLLSPPMLLLRLVAGRDALWAGRSLRVSNRRFRDATGWSPGVRDGREGWARLGRDLG